MIYVISKAMQDVQHEELQVGILNSDGTTYEQRAGLLSSANDVFFLVKPL